jgi:hypothetical protein
MPHDIMITFSNKKDDTSPDIAYHAMGMRNQSILNKEDAHATKCKYT